MAVLELRIPATGMRIEAIVWQTSGSLRTTAATLRALGLDAGDAAEEQTVSLTDTPGLRYELVAAEQALIITCTSACYPRQRLRTQDAVTLPISTGAGAYLNVDLLATALAGQESAAGAFELGVFNGAGHGVLSWTQGAVDGNEAVRLDTNWVVDAPSRRARFSVGDAIARGGPGLAPVRFGGLQFATDFSIDPTFVTFPVPALAGEPAAPAVVDLYIDGALRARRRVDPGPFEIVDAPAASGAERARLVVTDVLGRETVIEAPLFVDARLLRPGLSDVAFTAGFQRRGYGVESANYGDGFALASLRHGISSWATGEGSVSAQDDLANVGVGLAIGLPGAGQFAVAAAASAGENPVGAFGRFAWSHHAGAFVASADLELADGDYRRPGEHALPSQRARFSISNDFGRRGRVTATAVRIDRRREPAVQTWEAGYALLSRSGAYFGVAALGIDDGDRSVSVMATYTRPLGARATQTLAVESRGGDLTGVWRAQAAPAGEFGPGWRGSAAAGEQQRLDAGLDYTHRQFEARLDASTAPGPDGVRGQFRTGLILIEGAVHASRPVRQSFALVDTGLPGVSVYRDRRWVGRTDSKGRLLVQDMRPYEVNSIGIDIDELPPGVEAQTDEILLRPLARSGVAARFPITQGAAGAARVLLADATTAPRGAVLVRDSDGALFPVGSDGRVWLSLAGASSSFTLRGFSCRVTADAHALRVDAPPLICEASG